MARSLLAAVVLAGAIAASVAAEPSARSTSLPPPILFAADNAPALSGDVFRLDANGRLVNLSRSPFADENPLVSPDGRRVAFVSERGGGPGIYDVGIDGAHLQRLDPPPHQIGASQLTPQLAWSPDGRLLAAVTGDLTSTLRILAPGRTPKVLARSSFLYGPAWSPDGRLLTVEAGPAPVVHAYTATGNRSWTIPSGTVVGWSKRGLFATIRAARVRVYDEHGRLRYAAPAHAASWSPDGTRLATVARGALVVRTEDGRVFLQKRIRGLAGQRIALAWMDARRVLVNLLPRVVGVDTATGKLFAGSIRFFYEPRSPDGRLLAETTRQGSRFAVETTPLLRGTPRVYGRVGGCFDDGVFEPQLRALQFVPGRRSLVYESYCPEPLASLYAVNPDGTGLTRLTQDRKHATQPAWSPDGTRIAYTRYDAVGLSCKGCPGSLVVSDADGSSPRLLTTPTGEAYADTGASWSPDGTKILFSRWTFSSGSDLLVVPAAGGPAQSLGIDASQAAWGPTRIAYVDLAHQPASLWTALPDGSDRQKVAEASGDATLFDPAWSRDGRLVFADGRTGAVGILSGGVEQRVQLPFTEIGSIAWSPDGMRFVVTGLTKGAAVYDVYTVRTDGSGLRRLTTNIESYGVSWR